MKQAAFYFLAIFILPYQGWGQGVQDRLREEIAYQADVMVNASIDKHRIRAKDQLEMTLDTFLATEGSYYYSLDSIPQLAVLQADDFRIVTWQLRISDEEYKYGGFIQWPARVVHFSDSRPFINGSLYMTYTPVGWYGCLYYHIEPFEREGHKYYVLLGFHAENSLVNTKVADVLDLTSTEPRFGVPVFTGNEQPRTRLMISYADVSAVHLAYDAQLGGIVHDHVEHLPGVGPQGESLPVSDGSLEGWVLKKGNWEYEAKVYDVKQEEPPMIDERKDRKEDKDILGRPKKE